MAIDNAYYAQRGVINVKAAINTIRHAENVGGQYPDDNVMGYYQCLPPLVGGGYRLKGTDGALSYLPETFTDGHGDL